MEVIGLTHRNMLRHSTLRPFLRAPSQQRLRAADGNGDVPESWGAGRILRVLEVSRANLMEEETLVPAEC